MTRWTLGLSDPNVLGGLAAVVVCALVGLGVAVPSPGRWWRWAWAACAAAALVVLTASLSRGAWLAVVLVCGACLCWPGALERRWLAAAMPLLLVGLVVCWPRGVERMGHLAQGVAEAGSRTRLAVWRVGCAVVADHPGTGVPGLGVRGAIEILEPAPEHLRAARYWPVENVCNDLLDRGIWGGLPAMAVWLVGFAMVIAVGVCAFRAGSPWGLGLAAAAVAGLLAGQWSCLWTQDRVATALALGLGLALLTAVLLTTPARGPVLIRSVVWGAVAGLALTCAGWGVCLAVSRQTGMPRLVAMDGGAWAAAPRGASYGSLVWHMATGDTVGEIRRDVLAAAARHGWTASIAVPAGPSPVVAVGREGAAGAVLGVPAQARILSDCPPTYLDQVAAAGQPVLCVFGQPDPRGWADAADARLAPGQVLRVPLGRLWSTRFPRLMPLIEPWLQQQTPRR